MTTLIKKRVKAWQTIEDRPNADYTINALDVTIGRPNVTRK